MRVKQPAPAAGRLHRRATPHRAEVQVAEALGEEAKVCYSGVNSGLQVADGSGAGIPVARVLGSYAK